jgi:hypothetical protein
MEGFRNAWREVRSGEVYIDENDTDDRSEVSGGKRSESAG